MPLRFCHTVLLKNMKAQTVPNPSCVSLARTWLVFSNTVFMESNWKLQNYYGNLKELYFCLELEELSTP